MNKNQRIAVLVALTTVLAVVFLLDWTRPVVSSEISTILFAALFLLSFATLLLEHFFGRPTDVMAAAVSILLLIIPNQRLKEAWGIWYDVFLSYELLLLLAATTALLLLTDAEGPSSSRNRASRFLKTVAVTLGPGRIQYFWLFFLTLLFFVEPRSIPFVSLALYAALVLFIQPQRALFKIPEAVTHRAEEVGEIFGVQGKNTFLVRLHPGSTRPALRFSDLLEFTYGMDEPARVRRGFILERFFLDQAQWIRVLCHGELDRHVADLDPIENVRTDAVYRHAGKDVEDYLGELAGVVREGTEIGTLRFLQAGRAGVEEGDLVEVHTSGARVLYQVAQARVNVESLESRNEADFVVGEAIQLGRWDSEEGTFDRFGWVPSAYTPVLKAGWVEPPVRDDDEFEIGRLPGTEFPVLLNRRVAISHHTAILGVTGVGKSVFARNLIRQLLDEDVRVIVVDFTREWREQLEDLGASPVLTDEESSPLFKAIESITNEKSKFRNKWDHDAITEWKTTIFEGFRESLEDFLKGPDSIRIFELPEVSNTEGVLEYTQWFFKTLFHLAKTQDSFGKRVCIVLEEAHTVVPE